MADFTAPRAAGSNDALPQKFKDLGDGSAAPANVPIFIGAASSNGLTNHRKLAAATTNATSLKAAAGRIVTGTVYNLSAAAKFLKFYDKASAPTVGTDTPILTIPIAAAGRFDLAAAFGDYGLYFATGIAYALTGAVGDADTTVLVANDVVVNIGWV